jgi:predicted DNA-binding protein (MmcQ/YjbR family)
VELREKYEGIQPGYHMNKKHWNTIIPSEGVPDKLVFELIDHSYELICSSLSKAERMDLA